MGLEYYYAMDIVAGIAAIIINIYAIREYLIYKKNN